MRLDPILRGLVALAVAGAGLASVLGLLGGLTWRLDLLSHFRGLYILALMPAAALAWRRRWPRLTRAAAALLTLNLALAAPYALPGRAAGGPGLRLLHFNVLSSNQRRAEVVDFLAGSGADLVFVQEVDARWAEALRSVPGYWPVVMLPRRDNFGLAALVRDGAALELAGHGEVATAREVPAIAVRVRHAGRELAVLSLHTLPPMSAAATATRDAQLQAAADWAAAARAEGAAPVVLGDFNATPFSAGVSPLPAAGLRDSLRDGALRIVGAGTWPALPWPLRIAIDHCWHDPTLVTRTRTVGPALGSDHRPLTVELAWAD